jgi:hypothetical protein
MGILVFGTPTLLLLGFDFTTVLGLLLPSSISISTIQVWSAQNKPLPTREKVNMMICMFVVVVSLTILVQTNQRARADILIGLTMLTAALIRNSSRLQIRLENFIQNHNRFYVSAMGTIHGLTNLGGALLAIYATSGFGHKNEFRATIARYYLLFGVIQICTLAVLRRSALSLDGLAVAPIAVVVYFIVGNVLFKCAGAPLYERAMTAFIGMYGAVVLVKTFI